MKSLFKNIAFISAVAGMVLCSTPVKSQDFAELMTMGAEDTETYLENYVGPGIYSMGNGLAGGWYNTAKTHKTLGFDLTVTMNLAAIPEEERMFEFIATDFQNMQLRGDSDGMLPTLIGGSSESGSEIFVPAFRSVDIGGGQSVTLQDEIAFPVPSGIDLGNDLPVSIAGFPTPTANLGIGIYKNTDLRIRWTPEYSIQGFQVKMFGIGVMHDVKQWIPGIKNLPFDLSAFFGTSTLSMSYDIDEDKTYGSGATATTFTGTGIAEYSVSATTFQAIISKKLLFFTPYASLGFNAVKSNLDVKGEYTIETSTESQTVNDPVSLEFDKAGGPRASFGARINLLIFTFHTAYTFQKYSNFEFGVGISVR